MDTSLRNLYYRMYMRMFSRYLSTSPTSILDFGCGTGRDLDILSHICPDCWGVDCSPQIIKSARNERPHLRLLVSDMRNIRLGRTFDVIICMGSGFMYARSKEDVARILDTFAAHAHTGTLLILDVLNSASFINGDGCKDGPESRVNLPQFPSAYAAMTKFARTGQPPVKQRIWNIPGRSPVKECCQYRSFSPDELKHLLAERSFRVVGMFDNMDLKDSNLSGLKLYVDSVMLS